MIRRFIDQVVNVISEPASAKDDGSDREAALRLATAVLMLDVARADHVFDESEFDRILDLFQVHFRLPAEDAAELLNVANERADEAVSAYEFTQLLHEHLDEQEKARIVALLWQIAYADGRLDKYEDAFVLKISDLLYVNRGSVMRLKHEAQKSAR